MIVRALYFMVGFLVASAAYTSVYDPIAAQTNAFRLARQAYFLGCARETKNFKYCLVESIKYHAELNKP